VLCDPRGRPVPAGVPGEVWIGGAGVSRGYLGAPELTAERFPEVGGSRFYRSGDLARWLEDGELQFLGRTDRQVKIRGFRIEPAEIEGALRAHPQVREAAVAAHGTPERRHLVAYLVAAGGEPPAAPALRTFLRARLPEHMIPAAFVPLAALPLSANGKIDRGALPPPDARPEAAYVAPRSAVERVLAAIWGRLLEVDRVGATDDFFALGGHSLVATQIVSRVRRTFRIDLPLGSFFAATTVAELAALVVALEPRPGVAEAIALALQAARSGPPPSGEPPRPGAGGEA
jgi:acyl carrier protein